MKSIHSLVLLANEGEARLLQNDGVGKGLRQIAHFDRDAVSGEAVSYSDNTGRSRAGVGAAHHGMDRSSSENRQNRERFARDLIRVVENTWDKGEYDRLYVAAPPKMLGALRECLSKPMMNCLSGDIAKDLLNVAQSDLPAHFKTLAAF